MAVGGEHRLAVDGKTAERVTDRCRCDSPTRAVMLADGDMREFVCVASGQKVGYEAAQ